MTFDQFMSAAPLILSILSIAILIGMWRGRQEAADKAAEKAIENTQTASTRALDNTQANFDLRIKNIETKLDAQGVMTAQRILMVDRDIAALRDSIGEVKTRMSESEAERREEFQRLHKIGNETHALIVKHLTELQRVFVPRSEYDARHHEMDRRVARLEDEGGK